MDNKKDNYGGSRPGSGRKKKEGELVTTYTVALLPSLANQLIEQYGSLTKAIKAAPLSI